MTDFQLPEASLSTSSTNGLSTIVVAPAFPKNHYEQILKSSILIGGSSVLSVAIAVIRTKAVAMMLGPAGFGLMGLYMSIADLTRSVAEMGVNNSGVRQIAEAASSGDQQRVARTATVLRRLATALGVLGAVLLAAFSTQVSVLTFGDDHHAGAVALLSLAVFFGVVAAGQCALIQGMRRIPDLAMLGVLGAFFGTVIGIPMVYVMREDGVVPSLVVVAAMSVVTSWWYSQKIRIQPSVLTASEVRLEAAALLKLGMAFMASGLLTMGAAYAVRLIVLRNVGLEAAGLYQSAWTLGGLYVAFVLQAMGADFYPRLVGVAQSNAQCNRLVNEQARVSLLLAGPGVMATLTFAPMVIALFYTAEFTAAVDILRWICLGMTLRVLSWPMGFIVVAKGKQAIFFASEMAWAVVGVGLAWLFVRSHGLSGAGMAFFGSYVFHALMMYPIVRTLSSFRWSVASGKTGLIYLSSTAGVFLGFYFLPPLWGTVFGIAATLLSGIYSVHILSGLVSLDALPKPVQRLLALFRFSRSGSR